MEKFDIDAFNIFDKEWALVTAGNIDNYNTMTISWGGLGTLWNKPVATVYVRPNRYTYKYMEENEYFTVSFYDEKYKKALGVLGSKSGKDCDKVALAGFNAIKADNCVTFEEAKATLVLKKIYFSDLADENIPDDVKERYYLDEPIHRMYIGEVVGIIK